MDHNDSYMISQYFSKQLKNNTKCKPNTESVIMTNQVTRIPEVINKSLKIIRKANKKDKDLAKTPIQ